MVYVAANLPLNDSRGFTLAKSSDFLRITLVNLLFFNIFLLISFGILTYSNFISLLTYMKILTNRKYPSCSTH